MYKFTDVSESEVAGGGGTMKKGGGCYVSATTGKHVFVRFIRSNIR